MTTLENFDPLSRKSNFLDSPRSLEALKRLGFEEHELLRKNIEEYKETPIPEQFKEDAEHFLEVKWEFLERKRLEKVDQALKMREKIIDERFEEEMQGGHERDNSFDNDNKRFIEKERKRIEKMVDRKVILFILLELLMGFLLKRIRKSNFSMKKKNENKRFLRYFGIFLK